MSVKPILFNTEMVQAILGGLKTETRRVVRQHYSNADLEMFTNKYGTRLVERQNDVPEPESHVDEFGVKYTTRHLTAIEECKAPYNHGDILWVRETWAAGCMGGYIYKAGHEYADMLAELHQWKPSIHMPREAARLFLRVACVRAERLQDIDVFGAMAEGCDGRCESPSSGCPGSLSIVTRNFSIEKFQTVWDRTIKSPDRELYGWDANPWVWVVKFERCEKPEGWCEN